MRAEVNLKADLPVVVRVRACFDLDSKYPAGAEGENALEFRVYRGSVLVDQFVYDMHVTCRGNIAVPTFVVRDSPGAGDHSYRLAVLTRSAVCVGPSPRLVVSNLQASVEANPLD